MMPKFTLYAYSTSTHRCEVEAQDLYEALERGADAPADQWVLDDELEIEPTHLVIDESGHEIHLDLDEDDREQEAELPEEEEP
jgi:hypothetical protein